jgi:hypothetical protein
VPTWFTDTSDERAYLVSPELLDPDQYFIVVVDALASAPRLLRAYPLARTCPASYSFECDRD